jgi:alpha-1,2-rhamnosyltransferase
VIGVIGWNCSSIIKRLHNHEQLGKKLFVFHDINDIELLFIYKQAKALITASIMEGFGLPIIESLSRRCPVLASDIPVYREVGGDFCSYFDLEDSSSLADIIIKWEKTGQEPPHRNLNEFKWPTWKESTEELLKKIIDLNKR